MLYKLNSHRLFYTSGLLLILLLLLVLPVRADSATVSGTADAGSFDRDISGGYTFLDCNWTTWADPLYAHEYTLNVSVSGSYTVTGTNTEPSTTFNVIVAVFAGSYDELNCVDSNVGSNSVSDTWTLNAGQTYVFVVWIDDGSYADGADGSYSATISGSGQVCIDSACPVTTVDDPDEVDDSPQRVFFDGRINDFDTGNSVVLFGNPDDEDNWRLEVYGADESGLLLVVSAEIIASVPECPDSNTLIVSDAVTGISLWRLPERTVTREGYRVCPFQLNAPSTEPGKTYVIIFDSLYPSSYYESEDEWIGGR
jgi:hypothetical protein